MNFDEWQEKEEERWRKEAWEANHIFGIPIPQSMIGQTIFLIVIVLVVEGSIVLGASGLFHLFQK